MPVAFQLPRFYPILDTAVLSSRRFAVSAAARILLDAGVKVLQYRHKENWTQAQFDEAAKLRDLCHEAGVLFVINDRADFAKLLGAALHIGQNDLNPVAARRVIADEVLGFSTHNKRQLAMAANEPVEYLSLGPIFATTSKLQPDPVVGIDGLKTLRPLTAKPLVAIGGITLNNAASVFEAGANSAAVISGFLPTPCNPKSVKKRVAEWLAVTS